VRTTGGAEEEEEEEEGIILSFDALLSELLTTCVNQLPATKYFNSMEQNALRETNSFPFGQ
jgi:hypothetical protein